MTVSTFFPDVNAVDGEVTRSSDPETWATQRDHIDGTGQDSTAGAAVIRITTSATANRWQVMGRSFILFNTGPTIPDTDNIDDATLEVVMTERTNQFSDSLRVITTTPASDTALVIGDYDQVGTVAQAPDKTLASLTVDSATFTVYTLNATGRGNVSKTGITKFGLRMVADADNAEPAWVSVNESLIRFATAEEALAGDKRPKLVVTHTAPIVVTVPHMMAAMGFVRGEQQPSLIPTGVVPY